MSANEESVQAGVRESAQESLSSILSNSEPPEDKGEKSAPPAGKSEEKPEKARDETGKFKAADKADEKPVEKQADKQAEKPAEAKADAKPEPKPEPKPRADVAAIIDERRKRQALEQQLKELQAQKQEPKPSVFDDEDKAIRSRVDEGTRSIREQNYKLSVRLARIEHGESFKEAEEAFAEAAAQDDRLIAGLRSSDDPGEYIYTVGLQIRELADVGGDFVKYREKITAGSAAQIAERDTRIKALESEITALKKAQEDLESLPRSLNARASGSSPKAGEDDDEDIKSIARFNGK